MNSVVRNMCIDYMVRLYIKLIKQAHKTFVTTKIMLVAAPASDIFVRRHGHTDHYYGEKWLLLLSGPKRLNREFRLAKVLHFWVLGTMIVVFTLVQMQKYSVCLEASHCAFSVHLVQQAPSQKFTPHSGICSSSLAK